ncbi:MAG: hypothetical protein HFI66_12040 [Lachnospiraceae bacterium]|jgi:hypothetical protein|nr:hypothetical protein [Lachnospiraceae bacterium]
MKYRSMKERYQSLDLQLFAEEGDGGADGGEAGDEEEEETGEEEDPEEKKFSQKDLDEAVRKRLARERRKWARQRQGTSGAGGSGTGEKPQEAEKEKPEESGDAKARRAAEEKADALEVKIACFEAGVAKDAVDDVTALARAYMAADADLDLEDAVEKVVKKYPQFKKGSSDPYEEDGARGKSWGERQRGGTKKATGVEVAFLKRNPGLKIE